MNPLDQLSSATIALTVARLDNLPEATPIMNQADSETALLSVAPTNDSVIAKQQVVATDYVSNKDIKTYVVQPGDSIASIAQVIRQRVSGLSPKFSYPPGTITKVVSVIAVRRY